jgi:hypothetical protein
VGASKIANDESARLHIAISNAAEHFGVKITSEDGWISHVKR